MTEDSHMVSGINKGYFNTLCALYSVYTTTWHCNDIFGMQTTVAADIVLLAMFVGNYREHKTIDENDQKMSAIFSLP